MKELIIVGGPNGSGKTTFAKKFLANDSFYFLNADEISLNQGTTNVSSGKIFFRTLSQKLSEGSNILMESTLSGKYIVGKIQESRNLGYRISLVYLFLKTPEDCIQRIKLRLEKGGHFVPDDDVRRRFYRSKINFWNLYKNLADDWTLFYNFTGVEPVFVATGNEGEYIVESNDLFGTFLKDVNQ